MLVILCVDLKSFYASVECVLRGLDPFNTPLVVCDVERSKNSICLAVTPFLKNMGVKSRSRMSELPEIKNLIFAKPRMKKYIEYSKEVYKVYLSFFSKEDIHVYSIDEVFINLVPYLKYKKETPENIAKLVMKEIYQKTKINSTAGLGKNLFLAKVALDCLAKKSKNNIGVMNDEIFLNEISKLDLKEIYGFGQGFINRLKKYNVKNLLDLSKVPSEVLEKEFGVIGIEMLEHSKGNDLVTFAEVKNYQTGKKSISHGQVLFRDYNYDEIKVILVEMVDLLILSLLRINVKTKCISLNIGYKNGQGFNRQLTLDKSTISQKKLLANFQYLYEKFIDKEKLIRKIQVRATSFEINKIREYGLFDDIDFLEKEMKFYETYYKIKEKFGKNSINKAVSFTSQGNQILRNTLIGGHNGE